jgi:hypothetical protein
MKLAKGGVMVSRFDELCELAEQKRERFTTLEAEYARFALELVEGLRTFLGAGQSIF